uniref:Uncharacterized protein n=1 Tax=Glossina palpalis gambiensis TaxID=67801 RepID=A0A1B0BHG9_9MUSC
MQMTTLKPYCACNMNRMIMMISIKCQKQRTKKFSKNLRSRTTQNKLGFNSHNQMTKIIPDSCVKLKYKWERFHIVMSNQLLKLYRVVMVYLVAILTGQISESLGLLLSSRLNVVLKLLIIAYAYRPFNSRFMGPLTAVLLILFSTFGMGYDLLIFITANRILQNWKNTLYLTGDLSFLLHNSWKNLAKEYLQATNLMI